MLCSINNFLLADGTISGGVALSNLRLTITRYFDVVIPLGELDPVPLDRNKRRANVSFNVSRVHASIKDSETYILDHDTTVPRTGDAKLIVSVEGITTNIPYALIINGALVSWELVSYIGSKTEHAYTITGAPLFSVDPGVDRMLLETGDFMLMETGDKMLLD